MSVEGTKLVCQALQASNSGPTETAENCYFFFLPLLGHGTFSIGHRVAPALFLLAKPHSLLFCVPQTCISLLCTPLRVSRAHAGGGCFRGFFDAESFFFLTQPLCYLIAEKRSKKEEEGEDDDEEEEDEDDDEEEGGGDSKR